MIFQASSKWWYDSLSSYPHQDLTIFYHHTQKSFRHTLIGANTWRNNWWKKIKEDGSYNIWTWVGLGDNRVCSTRVKFEGNSGPVKEESCRLSSRFVNWKFRVLGLLKPTTVQPVESGTITIDKTTLGWTDEGVRHRLGGARKSVFRNYLVSRGVYAIRAKFVAVAHNT